MTDARTRHSRGLWVVILLGVIFFTLLGLIVLKSGGGSRDGETKPSETLTVLPVRIRIRTEPHARAPVVATATTGERLQLLEDRGAWVRVQTGDNLAGWAERANLERTAEQQRRLARYAAIRKLPPLKGVSHDRTTLYAGPGIFYPLVGEIDDGTEVVVYTRDHDFYAIDHNGAVAYADIDTIDVTAAGSRQLEVRTESAPPTSTSPTEEPVPTETVAEAVPIPEPEPPVREPEPEPAPVERSTGVYSVVPAGGTQPQELDRVVPRYPGAARVRNIQGAVVVRGIVRRDGTIDNVEIIKDLPYGLGDAARDAVRRWRFRPATLRGEPIDVYYTVTVNFKLQ
jgi:TonB family protein